MKPSVRSRFPRVRRHIRVRRRVNGTAQKPRLAVFRSLSHIYAQVIDDDRGETLAAASDLEKTQKGKGAKTVSAQAVGTALAERSLAKGVKTVVFDRGGFRYHGRVKALAEGARKAGLEF